MDPESPARSVCLRILPSSRWQTCPPSPGGVTLLLPATPPALCLGIKGSIQSLQLQCPWTCYSGQYQLQGSERKKLV